MRVIIDTNILVSGLISEYGAPAKIVDAVLEGQIIPVMSAETLQELEDVLSRPRLQVYFKRAGVSTLEFLEHLKKIAEFIQPPRTEVFIRDAKDRVFIELAAMFPPPEYLITGDKDFEQDRYHGVPVISASFFVQTLSS